jgi:hypothetical protein
MGRSVGFEIPVDLAYFDHPKTLKLIAFTGKSEADIYPLRLWKWAAEYARTGRVEGGAGQIELACKWRGRPGALHKALVDAGFIEKDGITIHDWMEHIGRAILIYDEKKRKKREKYAREHGLVPEQSREKHPYPGGEGRGGETQDEKPRRGGETAPTPPTVAAPRTPDSITDDDIVQAVHSWDPTFPDDQIRTQVTRAVRLGKTKGALLRDIQNLGGSMRIWTIVDGYQYPPKDKKNGNGTPARERTNENPTGYHPPVLDERREDIQKRQDEARAKCDQMLAGMSPKEREQFFRDSELEADAANLPVGPMREAFIKTDVRRRIAKQYAIEGI